MRAFLFLIPVTVRANTSPTGHLSDVIWFLEIFFFFAIILMRFVFRITIIMLSLWTEGYRLNLPDQPAPFLSKAFNLSYVDRALAKNVHSFVKWENCRESISVILINKVKYHN